MRLICNRTQNDAIWELIALFLTNQIAGNTIDFKMNVIKQLKCEAWRQQWRTYRTMANHGECIFWTSVSGLHMLSRPSESWFFVVNDIVLSTLLFVKLILKT